MHPLSLHVRFRIMSGANSTIGEYYFDTNINDAVINVRPFFGIPPHIDGIVKEQRALSICTHAVFVWPDSHVNDGISEMSILQVC